MKTSLSNEQIMTLANLGFYFMEAYHDCEAYLPPDDSESWFDADAMLKRRDDAEQQFIKALNELIPCC